MEGVVVANVLHCHRIKMVSNLRTSHLAVFVIKAVEPLYKKAAIYQYGNLYGR